MEKNVLYKSCRVQTGTPDDNLDFDLGVQFKGHFKILIFLNKSPYFLLHILVTYLESFPKHYNNVFFHGVLFEL